VASRQRGAAPRQPGDYGFDDNRVGFHPPWWLRGRSIGIAATVLLGIGVGVGHVIWWLPYDLWNPVLLAIGHWLFKVLLPLIAVGSVADVIRHVVEALSSAAIAGIIVERRRTRQRLRQQAISRRSGSRSRPSLAEAAPAAGRSEGGGFGSRPFVEEPQLPEL
jgi:hypothetical protein